MHSQRKFSAKKVIDFYTNVYDESTRLMKDRRHIVEFRLKEHLYKTHILPGSVVYDIGAGSGFWTSWLLENVPDVKVYSFDIVPKHVDEINSACSGKKGFMSAQILDVSKSFTIDAPKADVILLSGPFYHIDNWDVKLKMMQRAANLLKSIDSILMVDWLSAKNAAMETILTDGKCMNKVNLIDDMLLVPSKDNMFSYSNALEMDALAPISGLEVIGHYPLDGISRLVSKQLEEISEENFEKWISLMKSFGSSRELCDISEHNITIYSKF